MASLLRMPACTVVRSTLHAARFAVEGFSPPRARRRVRLVRLVRQPRAEYSSRVSKAFTRESDEAPPPPAHRRGVPVPDPNYMTPAGARAAREELAVCTDVARIRELTEHLATAQIIEPPADRGVAGLGASVTIEDATGKRTRYRIVGALEADARRGLVFWQSPLAEALYGTRVGDPVTLPRGVGAEVVAVEYE
jgi:transcription elongation GreA/GreB family factor